MPETGKRAETSTRGVGCRARPFTHPGFWWDGGAVLVAGNGADREGRAHTVWYAVTVCERRQDDKDWPIAKRLKHHAELQLRRLFLPSLRAHIRETLIDYHAYAEDVERVKGYLEVADKVERLQVRANPAMRMCLRTVQYSTVPGHDTRRTRRLCWHTRPFALSIAYAYACDRTCLHDRLGFVAGPRATAGGNKDGPVHHRVASAALWRSHCEAGISDMSPIPCCQNRLCPVFLWPPRVVLWPSGVPGRRGQPGGGVQQDHRDGHRENVHRWLCCDPLAPECRGLTTLLPVVGVIRTSRNTHHRSSPTNP